MSTPNDNKPSPAAVELALAEEKANQEKIGATVQAARASTTQPEPPQDPRDMVPADIYIARVRELEQQRDDLRVQLKATFLQLSGEEQKRDALQAQRDDLLAAMHFAKNVLNAHGGSTADERAEATLIAERAIARATSKQGAGQ